MSINSSMYKLNQFNLLVSKSGVSVICPRSHSLIGAEPGVEPRSLYPFPCFCHNLRLLGQISMHSIYTVRQKRSRKLAHSLDYVYMQDGIKLTVQVQSDFYNKATNS